MASELLKTKALSARIKEPKIRDFDFGLNLSSLESLLPDLPQPKPPELLDIQEQNRKQRLLQSLQKIGGGLEDSSLDFIRRQNFDEGSDYFTNRVTDSKRLKFLNEAAKKLGYDSWSDVPKTKTVPGKRAYGDREKIAQEATRRQKGVVEGQGKVKPTEAQKANIKKSHWVNKSEAEVDLILNSPKYKEYWAKKTQNQADLLKTVKSGKYKTSEEIRKAVGFEKDVFNKEIKNLFKNVYTQIGDLNKPKKMQTRFGVSFLPRDLDEMYELRSKLGQIDGFESVEQRNIYQQIDEAYGQRGTNPNRKAFAEATKKASDFSRVKNAIKAKYPSIRLELDHPLDYKTIKSLGKGGEKFLFVTPVEKAINRGFKATLGNAYAKAIKAKDKSNILKIENLADDIGVTIGQVRGSKVMNYGTGPLRTTDLGDEIIANLRQQNVIVDNVKKLQKSGELKTRLADVGIPRAGEIGYSAKKVSESQIKGIKKIIASIGCPGKGKAEGGRIGFSEGTDCFNKGLKAVNEVKIKPGAQARNFAKFANRAYKLGRGIMKFGVIPEALFVGADSLIRMNLGDTLDESLYRAADFFIPGNQTDYADVLKIERTLGGEAAEVFRNVTKWRRKNEELQSLEQAEQADLALAGTDFAETNSGVSADETRKTYAGLKDKKRKEVLDASVSKDDQVLSQSYFDQAYDISKAKSTSAKIRGNVLEDESGLNVDLLAPEKNQQFQKIKNFREDMEFSDDDILKEINSNIQKKFYKNIEEAKLHYYQTLFAKKKFKEKPLSSFVLDDGYTREQVYGTQEGEGFLNKINREKFIRPGTYEATPEEIDANFDMQDGIMAAEGGRIGFSNGSDATTLAIEESLKAFERYLKLGGKLSYKNFIASGKEGVSKFFNSGGRVGFADGPDSPGRRKFMKLAAGLASLPILGKFFKGAKVAKLIKPIPNSSTAMPDWFPNFVDKFIGRSIGKKIDADFMEYTNPDLPNIKLSKSDDGKILVEGRNEFNESYNINYEPPGYEVLDYKTGKSVKTSGEFEAVEGRHVALGPEDYDTDPFYAEDLDDLFTSDVADMEKYATGNVSKTVKDAFGKETGLKKGKYDVDMAQGQAENRADILRDEGLDEID